MLENLIFETHFDIIPFDVYVVDIATYNIVYMNKHLKERQGDSTGLCCYKAFFELEQPCLFCKIRELVTKDGKPNGKTFVFEHFNDLHDRWYQLQEKALCWPDGRVAKYSIAVDISELKETQNRLAEAHATLALKSKELEILSATDRLTKVYNRLRLDEFLKAEFQRSRRYGNPLSVIMLDIDHFKRVNDTHGHQAGDQVLCEMAGLLESHIRRTDLLGRWGGEEFMVICTETDLPDALDIAEKIRCAIETHPFPVIESMTVSLGVAELKEDDTMASIIKRADAALYEAKQKGRNRVEAAVQLDSNAPAVSSIKTPPERVGCVKPTLSGGLNLSGLTTSDESLKGRP
ncbi:MAG: GGDEF domain-containing protein [Deltaproteobacteria bacterium]|nr:GGDEF domain-containing protein [Deltaproteobacteria bacterium]MBF0523889.1 GGDEF domain-containing protein [Deltaproteobacteria bacterium]